MYDLILFLVLLVLGYVFGQLAEKRVSTSRSTRVVESKALTLRRLINSLPTSTIPGPATHNRRDHSGLFTYGFSRGEFALTARMTTGNLALRRRFRQADRTYRRSHRHIPRPRLPDNPSMHM